MVKSNKRESAKRILIVDDHPFMRVGLASSLNCEDGLAVCGEASSAEEALNAVQRLKPDLLIADLGMRGKSGLELLRDVRALVPNLPVIVLSMHDETIYGERALRAGARGYVMKSEGPAKLLEAIRRVLAGGIFVSQALSAQILEDFSGCAPQGERPPIRKLTDREFEVFRLIGEGNNTGRIAKRLHVSPKTVEAHNANIRRKLSIDSSVDLLHYAVRWVQSET